MEESIIISLDEMEMVRGGVKMQPTGNKDTQEGVHCDKCGSAMVKRLGLNGYRCEHCGKTWFVVG